MAHVRPDRSNKKHQDSRTTAQEVPLEEPIEDTYAEEYKSMHSSSFPTPPAAKLDGVLGLKSGKTVQIESIVSTLANLQYTVKGKLDGNGKIEVIFCSPEPIVTCVPNGSVPRISDYHSTRGDVKQHRHERDKVMERLEKAGWIRKRRKTRS